MNSSPSRYGGVAAALVFGIGLLCVGKVAGGLVVIGVGLLVFALMLWPDLVEGPLFIAVATVLVTGFFLYHAIRNEFTGTATYYHSIGKHARSEHVIREKSPEKFRMATNYVWAASMGAALVGTIFFRVARKAEDWDPEI